MLSVGQKEKTDGIPNITAGLIYAHHIQVRLITL